MKPFTAMNIDETGKTFLALFPEFIPAFLDHMYQCQQELNTNQESLEKDWKSDIEFPAWLNLANITTDMVKQYVENNTVKNTELAPLLFKGYAWVWTEYCLFQYATTDQCPEMFRKAISLFFGEYMITLEELQQRKKELDRAVRRYMRNLASLVYGQKGSAVEIITANENLKIGVPENALDGEFEVTCIRVADEQLSIQLDHKHYYPVSDLLANHLRIEDQLAIANKLYEFLHASDTP